MFATSTYAFPHAPARKKVVRPVGLPMNGRRTQPIWIPTNAKTISQARSRNRCFGFRSMSGRFSSPVFPGEPLTIRVWLQGDNDAVFQTVGGDGRVVLDAGQFTFGPV